MSLNYSILMFGIVRGGEEHVISPRGSNSSFPQKSINLRVEIWNVPFCTSPFVQLR